MSSRYRPPTTDQARARADTARADKLTALHDRLAEQVAALRTGEDWQRWLRTAARFHTYSFQNTLLILAQRPDATTVAGYEAWKALGRQVSKGEKGIAILAPILRRASRDGEAAAAQAPGGDEPATRRIAGFRPAYVWDVSQTTGDPLPEQPMPALLHGQAPDGLWDALAALVAAQGYTLDRGDCGGANGITNPADRTVRVRADLDDAQAVKTLAHELAHVRLHTPDGAGQPPHCRGTAEVEAESVAYLVAASHGLDASGYTFPYVAGWAAGIAGRAPEDVVRATGERVLGAARWVLATAQAPEPDVAAAQDVTQQVLADRVAGAVGRSAAVRVAAAPAPAPVRQAAAPAVRVSVDPAGPPSREELVDLHRQAAAFFRDQLAGSWVPQYLDGRSLAPALDPPWDVGYAPRGWTALLDHLREQGRAGDGALLASGLAIRARTGHLIDRLRDRLVLPLRDPTGDVVAFIGRAHPDADPHRVPRYLNSPETDLYRKRDLLYGLHEAAPHLARGARPVLVEGPLDAIAVTTGTAGRCVGVAPCGTSLTATHIEAIASVVDLRSRAMVVATDADQAGLAAAERALRLLLDRRIEATAAALPNGSDPAAILHHHGPAALTAALLERAVPLADLVIDHTIDQWGDRLHWLEGSVGALREVAPLVGRLPIDGIRRLSDHLAERLHLDPSTIHRELVPYIGLDPPATVSPLLEAPVVPSRPFAAPHTSSTWRRTSATSRHR